MKKRILAWTVAVLLLAGAAIAEASLSRFEGKRIAVISGTMNDIIARNAIGEVQTNYYNTPIDAIAALRGGKADYWCTDEPIARFLLLENTDLSIGSRDYDFLGMAGEILQYCRRNQIPPKLSNRIQLAFEEAVQQLLPALEAPEIEAVCEYAEQPEHAEWTMRYGGPPFDPTEAGDGLSLKVLRGMTEAMAYSRNEAAALQNQLRLTIR